MDVNLLYFTVHGSEPTALTTWGAILIEDGEMESFVGSGNTELDALVEGLTTCLERFPTSLPIIIRSRHRQVLQLGKRWLQTWRENGWEDEPCPSLIAALMDTIEIRKIEWFNPPYAEMLDKTALEYAIDEWEYQDQHRSATERATAPPSMTELEDSEPDSTPLDSPSPSKETETEDDAQTEPTLHSVLEIDTPTETIDVDQVDTEEADESIETDDASPNEAPFIEEAETPLVDHSHPNTVESESLLSISQESNIENTPSSPEPSIQQSTSTLDHQLQTPQQSVAIVESDSDVEIVHHPNPENPIQYPYIDDEGWKQFYTLFDPPYDETVHRPTRILAYVCADHNLDLAAWSFALIDRPSTFALIKTVGHRHSTHHRALLQGCISVMQSLKHPEHSIEFRSDNSDLVSLIQQLIEDPFAECFEPWDEESAFVSQLSFYLEQRPVVVKYISDTSTDRALSIVRHLSTQGLANLNYGVGSEQTIRKKRFPLEELPDCD